MDRDPKYTALAEIYEGQLDAVLAAWKDAHWRALIHETPGVSAVTTENTGLMS